MEALGNQRDEVVRFHATLRERLEAVRERINTADPTFPIRADEWRALIDELGQLHLARWSQDWMERDGDSLHISFREIEYRGFAPEERPSAWLLEVAAADEYTRAGREGDNNALRTTSLIGGR